MSHQNPTTIVGFDNKAKGFEDLLPVRKEIDEEIEALEKKLNMKKALRDSTRQFQSVYSDYLVDLFTVKTQDDVKKVDDKFTPKFQKCLEMMDKAQGIITAEVIESRKGVMGKFGNVTDMLNKFRKVESELETPTKNVPIPVVIPA